ncbi:hypothetical protein V1J52_01545 [Streptomyces sp. TRM 70351]|uniref:hypothetical protein n=1 Tax=Streptomyces sp. TRM 70351 TaxID=3116552 RepID=UPI002E7B0C89|nr:hypothetical protein [Streptomyces sp. TRM 70351]MEE1926878.1 hypothetical protein [Streptomyces sp. TRM 70351]
MTGNGPVRCPVCRREHLYTPPVYPCPCGAPVALPMLPGGVPLPIRHRTWAGSWVAVRCTGCGRDEEWPQPELGCSCGALLALPVDRRRTGAVPPAAPAPQESVPYRPAFTPVTIRTARDAVLAAAHYLRWLGFTDVRAAQSPPASGIDLRGPLVVARVDPTTTPTAADAVETVWITGMHASVTAVCFALAGYAAEARTRAEQLALPLFALDLTGTPQPVNGPAERLARTGA